jgi:hypothetical protein
MFWKNLLFCISVLRLCSVSSYSYKYVCACMFMYMNAGQREYAHKYMIINCASASNMNVHGSEE